MCGAWDKQSCGTAPLRGCSPRSRAEARQGRKEMAPGCCLLAVGPAPRSHAHRISQASSGRRREKLLYQGHVWVPGDPTAHVASIGEPMAGAGGSEKGHEGRPWVCLREAPQIPQGADDHKGSRKREGLGWHVRGV